MYSYCSSRHYQLGEIVAKVVVIRIRMSPYVFIFLVWLP